MKDSQMELLKTISELDFTIIDLQLYLDTHPCDLKAIAYFNDCVSKVNSLKETYHEKYGMLQLSSEVFGDCFEWANQWWPWEKMEG